MDLNYDGMISAQEACLYADYDYPYPSRCYLLPNEVATTDDSTTTTDPAVAETQEYLDFLVGWYKVDRDLDGVMQKDDLYYIRSSTLFTSDQIDQEYSYLSGGVSPVPDTLNRDDVFPIILQHSMMQDSFQNWFNTTDYGQDGYLNSTELASTSNRNTNVTSTSGADVSEIEACLMWFSDYENSCYGYESLGTDVTSEDFIKGWYEVDTDFDNSVTRDQFVEYFSQDGLTTEMAGEMFDAYFPSMTTVDFSAAVTKNTEVDEKMTLLHTIYAIINNSTYADFDVTDVENVYNELLGTGIIDAAVDFTGATWYDSIGLADYTKATFHEVCSFIVDEYQCTQQEYEVEQETEAAAVADSIYDGIRGSSIIQWYRIDTDKDEVIVEADLRAARSASAYTDDSVTAEFNHYDTNLDGIVTQEEAWEVRKHDYDAMSWWDAASDWMSEYSEGQWNGTEPVNTWNNDYNYNITTLSPFTFTVLDTNQDGYVSESEACSYVMGDASNICFEIEDTSYDWQM